MISIQSITCAISFLENEFFITKHTRWASKKSALETSKKRASSLYINGYETSKDRGLCAGEFSEGHNTRVLRNRKLRKVAGEERGSILCGVSLDWSSCVQNSCRTRANSRPTNWLR